MAGRFVRASKYRHVYGQPTRKEQCYDNLRISKNAWDTNLVKANPEYISVNWESSGGGAFAVIPVNERGKVNDRIPLFRGHTAAVLDTDWNPFDDHLLASASDDAKIFLWRVPNGFTLHTDADEPADIAPVARLTGHSRKVGHVLFNPSAQNVLASSSGDFTVKIWDIEQGKDRLSLKHNEVVQSLSWSPDGALLVTTSRDKKLRIWDTRQEKPAHEVPGHAGAKNSRAVWLGEQGRIATTGFSKMSDRQLGLWDARNPGEPVGGFQILDSISGVCMPFWDDGNKILYLAGKGDGNIRYFEYENDKFEYLSEYKSGDPQRGIAFLPKRGVNVHENEIARAYKTVNDTYIEPISFTVPRRAEVFQDDIYPPTFGLKSAMGAKEWFDGKTAVPSKVSLKGRYDGGDVSELSPAEQSKAAAAAPAPSTTTQSAPTMETEPPKSKPAAAAAAAPAPIAVAERAKPTEIKDNQQAMSAMASKFADKEESSEDDASSFEEIPKPVDRSNTKAATVSSPSMAAAQPRMGAPVSKAANLIPASTTASAAPPASSATAADSTTSSRAPGSGLVEGLKSHFTDIKSAQSAQLSEIANLKVQVGELTDLVKQLSSRLDTLAGSQNERIRRVELEVESLQE